MVLRREASFFQGSLEMNGNLMSSQDHIKLNEKYGAHNYHPLPIVVSKAERVWVWDPEGEKYMDMLSAYSALNQGHCHPYIIEALTNQLSRVTLTSRAFFNDQLGPFLQKLVTVCGMEMALPMNTGAEAVETAIKMARKWGYKVKGIPDGRAEIIVFANNFHGRTTTIVGFSSEQQYRDGFGPFTPGFRIVEFGNIGEVITAIHDNTAAILIEPIQGEGGILMPPKGFLKRIREICDVNNILFMADEIQTGLCRTGKWFACQHENVKPDVLILGKALGGGLIPVSAVVSSKQILSVFKPGDHGSTFGGYPLACAVGMAALEVLENEHLADRAAELGDYFMDRLRAIKSPHIKEIRGRGLLIGLEVKRESGPARPFCQSLLHNGILCKETHDYVVRFAPPLVITKQEIDWALQRIEEVFTAPAPQP